MRRACLALILSAAFAAAHAAPASAESVEKLLTVSNTEAAVNGVIAATDRQLRQAVQQTIASRPMSDEQKRAAEQLPDKASAIVREEVGWPVLKPEYVKLYRESFEQEEVDSLLAFYASSAARKMPAVQQKLAGITQAHYQKVQARLKQLLEATLGEARPAAK